MSVSARWTPPTGVRVTVEHLQVGGIQEFGRGRVRPFLSGLLGITRYAVPGDNEVRFSMGTGGGVKLFARENIGVRLDGRAYVTFGCRRGGDVCWSWLLPRVRHVGDLAG